MRPTLLEPQGGLTAEIVMTTVELVDPEILGLMPAREWSRLTRLELALVYDWAMRELLHASDNIIRRRPIPWVLAQWRGAFHATARPSTDRPSDRRR